MPPKTASNSVRVLLESSGFVFSKEQKYVGYPQIHLKLSEIVKLYDVENLKNYKIIQITRHPYERFVSSFFFQKKIIPDNYIVKFKDYNLEEFAKHLFKSINSENFIESFYGDVSFVQDNINREINWGGSRFYDTQVSWNDLNQEVTYFKLENISQDISSLRDFLQLKDAKLPKINSQNLLFDYISLLTQDSKKIISDIFCEDFKKLEYELLWD